MLLPGTTVRVCDLNPLYLPKAWCGDSKRRERAHVPEEAEFTTKPALGTAMLTAAASAGAPFAWVAADEVYGRGRKLREACENDSKGYVVTVPVNFTVTLPSGRKTTVSAVARLIPAAAWETRSCGPGCKGHRDYAWAWAATASPRHWVLIRRSLTDPGELAFFYCHAPAGRPVPLPILIKVAGKRWPVEECLQQGKGQAGLDQHRVRTWHSFHRHTVLSMCAQALLAVAAARPAPAAAGVRLARQNPAVRSVIVGSEVLLRGDLPVAQLLRDIRQVRSALGRTVAISYADESRQWLAHPELAQAVVFVTSPSIRTSRSARRSLSLPVTTGW
jgi:hypothetical protein